MSNDPAVMVVLFFFSAASFWAWNSSPCYLRIPDLAWAPNDRRHHAPLFRLTVVEPIDQFTGVNVGGEDIEFADGHVAFALWLLPCHVGSPRDRRLFACSPNAAVEDGLGGSRVPVRPQPVKTKKGMCFFRRIGRITERSDIICSGGTRTLLSSRLSAYHVACSSGLDVRQEPVGSRKWFEILGRLDEGQPGYSGRSVEE